MNKSDKTKEQLIAELKELQKRNEELEISEISRMQKEEILKESETKYRLLVESSTDMLFTVDLKGNFLFTNKAFKKALGYSPKEMRKINGFTLVHPDDVDEVKKQFVRIIAGKPLDNLEYRYKTKAGKYIHILNNAAPISDSEGNIVAALGIARDISLRKKMEEELKKAHDELEQRVAIRTDELLKANEKLNREIIDRKRMEKALRKSEEKYRAIFESFHDVYYRTDKEGLVTVISPSVRTHAGYDPEDIIGHPVTDFYLNPEDREIFIQKLKETGAVNDYELKLKAKDGSVIETSMSAHITVGDDGESTGVEGILRDISERKQAEKALKESEEKYRDLIENLSEVIYSLDASGKVLYVSPAIQSLAGYAPKEVIGQNFAGIIHADDLGRATKIIQKILQGESASNEYRIRAKSGKIRWIHTSSRPVFKGKQVVGLQGVLTDITERKEAERELKESEKKYRELIEKSLQGVVIIQDSRIVFSNKALARITGFTVKELLSLPPKKVTELVHPEDRKLVWGRLKDRLAGKSLPPHYEYRGLRKDGSLVWLEMFVSRIIFNGKPAVQGAIIDITERKKAEEALRESEEKYKILVETSPDAVTATNMEGKITFASQQTLKLFGFRSVKDIIGQSAFDFIAPEEHEKALSNLRKTLKAGAVHNEEHTLLKKDGTQFAGEWSTALVRDSKGKPMMIIATTREITERKKAEEEMKFMQFSIDRSADAAFWMGEDARFIYVNDAACRSLGYSRKELLNMSVPDIDPDFPADIWPDHWRDVKKRGSFSFESRHRTKEGKVFPIEVTVNYLEFAGKEYNCAFAKDITERKKTEATLRENEERFRTLVETAPGMLMICDTQGNNIYVSPNCEKLTGYTQEELKGTMKWWVHEDDTAAAKKAFEQTFQKGKSGKDFEYKAVKKNGDVWYASSTWEPLRDKEGSITGVVMQTVDITERKKTEEAQRESEEKYRSIFESIHDVYFRTNLKGIVNLISPSVKTQAGWSPEEIIGKPDTDFFANPGDREAIMERLAKSGVVNDYELRFLAKDGSLIEASVSANFMLDKAGNPTGLEGILRNISERKRAEKELQAREAYLDQLFESAQEAIVMADNDGRALRINQEFKKLFGFAQDEIQGKVLDELIVPKELRSDATSITRNVAQGEKVAFEAIRCRKDGTLIIVSVLASPIIVNGEQAGTYGIYRDITERKMADEQIKASLKEKEILLQEVHHRVKNNMQIISSLLNLQSRHIKDKASLELFKSSQNRVKSMALIHERLYQSKDFTRIDVADYVQSLINHLFITYGVDRDKVRLKIDIKDVFLNINTAIPCGLIINELVSNSLKHAFPDGKKGEIEISMHPVNSDEIEMTVRDSGAGMPEDMDFTNTKSLGLYLVSMLARDQLHGDVKLDKEGGTAFHFRLSVKK